MRRLNFIEGLTQDLRYALRVLRNSPAFATIAILSLALGIGANTAIFSVMDVLMLRPLPVKNPEGLRLVSLSAKERPRYSFNYPMFEHIRDRSTVFSGIFAWTQAKLQTPVEGDMALVPAIYATGDYFSTLGVPPIRGRVFNGEDDRPTGGKNGPVAVISEGYWERRYNRSANTVGQAITLNAVAVTIIGVMPACFFGAEVGTAPDVWVPLNLQRQLENPKCISSPTCWYLRVMGRFRPGLADTQAAAALQTISRGIMEDGHPPGRPDFKATFLAQIVQTEPGATGFTGLRFLVRGPLRVLMGLVGLVLLIACANMANLLTARASARHKEVAVRLALGAGRSRVVRQFLCESLLLSIAGAAGGFVVAVWATRALIAILSNTATLDLKPDWRVLLFTAAAAIATGFLFGLAPALRATRMGAGAALKERAAQIHGSEGRFGFTRILLGGQVALSILLLAAAGLLGETLVRLLTLNPGFDLQNLTVVSIDTSKLPQKGPALMRLYGRLVERAKGMPGVESASLMSTTPLTDSGWNNFVKVMGRTDLSDEQRDADINAVAPKLLQTMRIPLLAGRDFNDSDNETSEKVTIISDNAARRWFPQGALGSYIGMQDSSQMKVVGIAGNTKYFDLREAIPQTIFVPYSQWNQGGSITLRTRVPSRETYLTFKEILRQTAPGAPIRTIKTMQQTVSESLATERLTAYLSVFFAALALLLTSIGLYGILAYSVSRRTSEIGVRMALGASPGNVVWLVIREVMGHTTGGTIAGIAAVALSSKLIKSLLYEVHPNNPVTLFEAVMALTLVCIAAAWIPARRASRLDPMVALREE